MAEKSVTIKSIQTGLTLSSAAALGAFCFYLFAPSDSGIDPIVTATVQAPKASPEKTDRLAVSEEPTTRDQSLLRALDALDEGDIEAVIAARNELDEDDTDRLLLTWLIATSGRSAVPIDELREAQKQLVGWPSQNNIARNIEIAMARNPLAIMRLRLSLGDEDPLSFQGAFALANSYSLTRNYEKARLLLIPYWHSQVLSSGDEKRVLKTFEATLTERDHEIRYFNMMSRNRTTAGSRIAKHLEWDDLHDAWASVIRRQKGAATKMEELSAEDKKTAAFAFMRTEYLRRTEKDDQAIAVLAELPNESDFFINPDAWWDERRILSRHKFEAGDAQAAYDLVAVHQGSSDEKQIDAAFHAGWYALRGIKDPEKAIAHFKEIIEIAKGDISKARGYYWLGRALGEGEEARTAYQTAAKFNTTYYGWLAREELGKTEKPNFGSTEITSKSAAHRPALDAANRLISLDYPARARSLYTAIGWSWTDPAAIAISARQASESGDHFAALKIAKAAHWRGIDMGPLTHPLGAISDATGIAPVDHALAYSIARQESEFNIAAVSKANAKGLMQVLPGTAKEMARKIDVIYEASKLTTDANYNARLGVAYLNQQFGKFGGSYVLTFAAYNAGPSRAKEWIERFGDPRGKPLYDVIDWVEQIPFPETRSYVQRILENLQVYKTQLGQNTSIQNDLQYGTTKSN